MEKLEQDIQQARTRLAHNVQKAREAAGLSEAELAARVGVSEQQLAVIEAGMCDVPIDTLAQLANALHVSLSALFK